MQAFGLPDGFLMDLKDYSTSTNVELTPGVAWDRAWDCHSGRSESPARVKEVTALLECPSLAPSYLSTPSDSTIGWV
jgi:hypothetical protein